MANTDPSKKSSRFLAQEHKWVLVDSLYGGTSAMRATGETYLPRNPLEKETDWRTRLNRTYLFNAFKRSVQQAAGRVFQDDMKLEGYPAELSVFAQDVDNQGRDLTQFSKSVFIDALIRGVSYILVEFPRVPELPITLADAMAAGTRPYWVHIQATQVLAVHSTLIAGTERVSHFRFVETVTEVSEDGLEETNIQQIKAFKQASETEPVEFIVWRPSPKGGWVVHDQGVLMGVPTIPIVPIYTNRVGYFLGSPPLLDLAEVNIAHWQSTSEQRNILHIARVPFLMVQGVEPETDENGYPKEMEISVHSVLTNADDAKWVETNGNSLGAGRADLADLEAKMEQLGLALTTSRSGNTTATENSINAAEANSLLKDMALGLADGLEFALYYSAFYLDTDPGINGKVSISTRFAVDLDATSKPQPEVPVS